MGSGKGFICLDRVILDSWLWQTSAEDFRLAVGLLLMANWQDGEFFDGTRSWPVKRGSFITSMKRLLRDIGGSFTERKLRTSIARLEAADFIAVDSGRGRRHRTITIVNYERYQKPLSEDEEGESIDSPSKPDKKPKPRKELPEYAIKSARFLKNHIVKRDPGHKLARSFPESMEYRWAQEFDLMNRLDGRSWDDIRDAIVWLFTTDNTFVVMSPKSLRNKFDGVRKHMGKWKRPVRPGREAGDAPAQSTAARPGESVEEWQRRVRGESNA